MSEANSRSDKDYSGRSNEDKDRESHPARTDEKVRRLDAEDLGLSTGETSDREKVRTAIKETRRPGENPEDRALEWVEKELLRSLDECEPGTEKAYVRHVAELIGTYAGDIAENVGDLSLENQV